MSLDKVSENVKIMTNTIESELNYDTEGVGATPENIFEKTLPEDLPLEMGIRWDRHKLDFADALTLANGIKGTKHLQEHPELDSVSINVKCGVDAVSSTFQRSAQRRKPATGETFTRYGVATTKLSTGIGATRGNYKKIQDHLTEEANSVFNQ